MDTDARIKTLSNQIAGLQSRLDAAERMINGHKHTGADLTSKLPSGSGGGAITTQNQGITLSTTVNEINFTGAGVVASGVGSTTTVTIALTPPAGTDTNIQFNTAAAFAADGDFNWVTGTLISGGGDSAIQFGATNYSSYYVGIVQSAPAIALPQGTHNFTIAPFDTVAGGSDYTGGSIKVFALDSGASATNQPGQVWLQGGYNTFFNSTPAEIHVSGGGTGAQGGSVLLLGGNSGSFDGDGGDVTFTAGALNGIGHNGKIRMIGATGGLSNRAVGSFITTDSTYIAVSDVVYLTVVGPSGLLHARVTGRDTGNGDLIVAEFLQGFKTTAGPVLSLVGSLTYTFFYGDAATADTNFAVSGTDTVQLQVKGVIGRTYSWNYEFWYMAV